MKPLIGLDIETIPLKTLDQYPDNIQNYIKSKIKSQMERNPDFNYEYYASIDGDFGKVICVSLSAYGPSANKIKLKSFYGDDEAELLLKLKPIFDQHNGLYVHYNGLNFDIPFLIKRFRYHGIEIANKNYYNLRRFSSDPHFDIFQEWGMYDYTKGKTLEVLSYLHGLPSPKTVLSGDKVYETYLKGDWTTIVNYCEYDSATTLNLYLKIYQNITGMGESDYIFSQMR